MDITETRRENLRRWIAIHGTPAKEKSLFSQLKANGSFGERVARRIEKQYKMGAGYLDTPGADVLAVVAEEGNGALIDSLKLTCETINEYRLLIAYRIAGPTEKSVIDTVVKEVHDRLASPNFRKA